VKKLFSTLRIVGEVMQLEGSRRQYSLMKGQHLARYTFHMLVVFEFDCDEWKEST
jgi:hypothetical protein